MVTEAAERVTEAERGDCSRPLGEEARPNPLRRFKALVAAAGDGKLPSPDGRGVPLRSGPRGAYEYAPDANRFVALAWGRMEGLWRLRRALRAGGEDRGRLPGVEADLAAWEGRLDAVLAWWESLEGGKAGRVEFCQSRD